MVRSMVGFAPLLLFLWGCGGGEQNRRHDEDPLAKFKDLPAVKLTLPLLGGGEVSLQDLRGKPVLLTLFATWSLRCQAEVPLFSQLQERYGGRGLKVVSIAIGPLGAKGLPMVETFVEVFGISYPVLLSEPGNIDLVGALGAVKHVPRTLLLDRRGKVLLNQEGQTNFPVLYRTLDKLFKRAPKPQA